jgi:hypothetical protein
MRCPVRKVEKVEKVETREFNPSNRGVGGVEKVESLLRLNLSTLTPRTEPSDVDEMRRIFGAKARVTHRGGARAAPDPSWMSWPRVRGDEFATGDWDRIHCK